MVFQIIAVFFSTALTFASVFFFYTVKNMYMLQINSYIDHETWQ